MSSAYHFWNYSTYISSFPTASFDFHFRHRNQTRDVKNAVQNKNDNTNNHLSNDEQNCDSDYSLSNPQPTIPPLISNYGNYNHTINTPIYLIHTTTTTPIILY